MLLPDGDVMTACIKNCRLPELSRTPTALLHVYGLTHPCCRHTPRRRSGSPNGMFPMTNGEWLVTEINGDWMDGMTPAGKIVWPLQPARNHGHSPARPSRGGRLSS